MADTKLVDYVEGLAGETLTDSTVLYCTTGSGTSKKTTVGDLAAYITPQDLLAQMPVGGRLTLETGVPISTSDQTAKSTLYWTQCYGNRYRLWNGSKWLPYNLSAEKSVALSGLTSDKCYDVFAYLNSSTVYIDLGTAWTDDTTRALAVAEYDGTRVNSAQFTSVINGHTVNQYRGLHLGTIYTTGTSTTEDSAANRYVGNIYNKIVRKMHKIETASSWTYGSSTPRPLNNNVANRINCVVTDYGEVWARAGVLVSSASATGGIAIGVDSTSTVVSGAYAEALSGLPVASLPAHLLTTGKHYLQALELVRNSITTTYYASGTFANMGAITGAIRS